MAQRLSMSDPRGAPLDARIAPLLQQASARIAQNQLSAAEAALDRALAIRPLEPEALALLGLIRQKQGRVAEAEEFYRRALAVRPSAHVHYNLGTLFYAQSRIDEAIAAFSEAARLKPNYAEAHLRLGQMQHIKSDFASAEKTFRQVLRIQPNYLLAKQYLGGALADQGKGVEAEQVLRQALAMAPRDPRQVAALKHNLGVALKQQRRLPEAIEFFHAAESGDPDLPMIDYNRAKALEDMGDLEAALASYRRAIVRDPLNMHAHQDLNHLLYRLGRDGEFLQSFDEAAARHPNIGALPLLKGSFLFRAERYDEAAEALARAASLMPKYAAPHDMLGQIHARQGRFGDAIKAHERALDVEPRNVSIWSGLADALLQAGEPERARQAAERAIGIEPLHQGALARWGLALRKLGDAREEDLNDYESMVQVFDLPPPEGYDGMEAFNRDLNAYLDPMHQDAREPLEQTLRKGTQTHDNLIGRGHDLVERLRARIDEAILAYVQSMKPDDNHPLFRRRAGQIRYQGSWSARLSDCGFHTNHVHPFGWISSCYYVALPDIVAGEEQKQGWIKFGEPCFDLGLGDPIRRMVKPVPGRLVLFPSYMWHGTVPFRSGQTRTTIAFDAVPA
jgi:tetratricopeptide (TPR) repeat protein